MTATPVKMDDRLCSVLAAAEEQDPIGSGSAVTRLFVIETPTPWTDDLHKAIEDGTVSQRIRVVQQAHLNKLRATGDPDIFAKGYPALFGIAPDKEWSQEGTRRVLIATREDGPFAQFAISEYIFPFDSFAPVDLAHAYFEGPEHLAEFERFRNPDYDKSTREFFVCTHGHIDICCARFGIPLYLQARKNPKVRAWRTTHFGGHRFAPTAWEFPSGNKWAFLDSASTDRVLEQDGAPVDLAMKLRGWSGVQTHAQIVEREGLNRFGWSWLDYKREATVEATATTGPWNVRLNYESPEGVRGGLEAVVTVGRKLALIGCGPTFGEGHGEMNEYAIESIRDI